MLSRPTVPDSYFLPMNSDFKCYAFDLSEITDADGNAADRTSFRP